MICPFCGKEMQQGILSGDGRSNVTFRAGDKMTGGFDRLIGIDKITAARYTLTSFTIDAYYCTDCKKMIFDTEIKG